MSPTGRDDAATSMEGGCHCGNLSMRFTPARPPGELQVRVCTCTFCRKHRHRWTSDAEGHVEIQVREEAALNRYRFGTRTADFLVCRRCGICLAATDNDGVGTWAVVNVNVLDDADTLLETAVAVHYDSETEYDRRARRRAHWTPATITTNLPESAGD